MREITYFSANVVAQFDNKYDNMLEFNSLMMDASNNIFNIIKNRLRLFLEISLTRFSVLTLRKQIP